MPKKRRKTGGRKALGGRLGTLAVPEEVESWARKKIELGLFDSYPVLIRRALREMRARDLNVDPEAKGALG